MMEERMALITARNVIGIGTGRLGKSIIDSRASRKSNDKSY